MTTVAPERTAAPSLGTPRPAALRLIHGEYRKLRTTNAWWLFGLGALALLALTFLVNAIGAYIVFTQETPEEMSGQEAEQFEASREMIVQAANLFTSGQFFGVMFVMLLGIVLVTNEFHHQTATATFLATPHRTAVIVAKLVTAAAWGVGLWVITTTLNIPATIIFLESQGFTSHLGDWPVVRAILLNGLAYLLWGMLGVGFGVLIRNQIGATVAAIVLYMGGFITAAIGIFPLFANLFNQEWISGLQWGVPSLASQLMVSGTNLPGQPAWWVGGVVLVGWALLAGAAGVLIMRKRDIG